MATEKRNSHAVYTFSVNETPCNSKHNNTHKASVRRFSSILLLPIVALLLLTTISLSSQELDLVSIDIGNDAETKLLPQSPFPNAKLVNIFTSAVISVTNPSGMPYTYRFVTDGDSIGYATFWVATYYDVATNTTFSLTLYKLNGYGGALQWSAPLLEFFQGTKFAVSKPLSTDAAEFDKFIKKITNLQEKMLASQAGVSYVLGAGLPESCVINNEPINFNENEMIYYSQIAASDNSVDMCYKYFDSIDINCNYNSIYEFPILSSINISPNPPSNYLNVELAETHNKITAEVLDLSGKVLFETNFENAQNFRINFPFVLSNGTYMLHINADGRRSYTNFIIAK